MASRPPIPTQSPSRTSIAPVPVAMATYEIVLVIQVNIVSTDLFGYTA
jgi:hypothetical protein